MDRNATAGEGEKEIPVEKEGAPGPVTFAAPIAGQRVRKDRGMLAEQPTTTKPISGFYLPRGFARSRSAGLKKLGS